MATKLHTVVKVRKGHTTEITDTLEGLIKYFSYTLEVGHSYEPRKINLQPKTIKSFMSNLEKSLDIKEGACYERTLVSLKETANKEVGTVNVD